MKKKFRNIKILFILLLCIACLMVLIYQLKSPIFRALLASKVERVEQRHGISIGYSNAKIQGINTFIISEPAISWVNEEPFFDARSISLKIPIWHLITFRPKPAFVGIDSMVVNLHLIMQRQNLVAPADTSSRQPTQLQNGNLYNVNHIYRALGAISLLATAQVEITNFFLHYKRMDEAITVTAERITCDNGAILGIIRIDENGNVSRVGIIGQSQSHDNSVYFSLTSNDSIPIRLPLSMLNFTCTLDSADFLIAMNSLMPNSVDLKGFLNASGIMVFHPALSENEVYINNAGFRFGTAITPNSFSLDSTTQISINNLTLPMDVKISNSRRPRIVLKIEPEKLNAADLFESLPSELFSTLQGVRVQGEVQYELLVDIDLKQPDSLIFKTKLTPHNFKLLALSQEDFRMINDTFSHIVYINDSTNKSIGLNANYENFRSMDQISTYAKNAVVTSEDGGFYHHKGFDPDGFRYALVQNIKHKRLARGGSTITMQLVKNLYLNRKKNLLRKAEEALIVWLIETQQLVEKERILEVYLNIIDWGPNIFGIAEASKFYFDKEPIDIELNEAIFLASIIPRPSYFMQNFDTLGNLKSHMESYYSFISGKMHEREMISDEEYESLEYNFNLKGIAKNYLNQKPAVDSAELFSFRTSN